MVTQRQFLAETTDDILAKCTACGKCVEVCPSYRFVPEQSREGVSAERVAAGIVDVLRGGQGLPAANLFLDACAGSAHCREVCEDGVDPYHMMRLAKLTRDRAAGKRPAASDYHLVDLSLKLQVGAGEPTWYTRRPPADARADLVFYMGCNIVRTPHIALGVMEILDELGINYATVGGGANCCGIKQFRVGLDAAETVSRNTLTNFASLQPKEVVSWCPTCEVHFNDFGASYLEHEFPINHLSRLILRNLDVLRPKLRPVPLRVVLEEHAALYPGDTVTEDVPAILRAIPGLEVMGTNQHVYGYTCAQITAPGALDTALDELLSEGRRVGANAVVSIYHGCHRTLVKAVHKRQEPFEVVNWVSLLCRSLGREHLDRYRGYAALGDENAILEEAMALDPGSGIPIEKLRAAVRWEFGG